MLGKMSRSSRASVVLPLEEQPLMPTMMAFRFSMTCFILFYFLRPRWVAVFSMGETQTGLLETEYLKYRYVVSKEKGSNKWKFTKREDG